MEPNAIYSDAAEKIAGFKPVTLQAPVDPVTGQKQGEDVTVNHQITFGELMLFGCPNPGDRDRILRSGLQSIYLAIGSTDINSLIPADISGAMAVLRNPDTKVLNVLEGSPNRDVTNSWQYIWDEERVPTTRAPVFNPDGSLPAENQPSWSVGSNTLMFVGRQVKGSLVGGQMANAQRNVDVMQRALMSATTEIRQAMNFYAIQGAEQTSYAPASFPQASGVFERTDLNPVNAAGGLIASGGFVESAVYDIGAYIGFDFQVVGFTSNFQLGDVRTKEINRYPGSTPLTNLQYMEMLQAQIRTRLVGYNLGQSTVRIFEPTNGPIVPFFYEKDLPSATSLLMVVDGPADPALVDFVLGGQSYIVLARPNVNLYDLVVAAKGFTFKWPLRETSRKLYGQATA
jgi:hypothetical protein